MKPDTRLYRDVISQFVWDARIQPYEIGISVKGGVAQARERCINVLLERVKIVVCTGWVMLEGAVDRYDQCEDLEEAVRELSGLTGVTNLITVKPTMTPEYVKVWVEEAFQSHPELDAQLIAVQVCGSKVVLRGQVRSWTERSAAWRIACRAPGVTSIENQIEVVL
jgi:osmotically-inducible protein OsmY